MSYVNDDECIAAGLDVKDVKRITKGLSRYAMQAEKLGIIVFGGSSGQLHFDDNGTGYRSLVVAVLDGRFDGGDGGTSVDANDLLRSE